MANTNSLKILFYDIEILQHNLGDGWKTMGANHSFIISFGYKWGKKGKTHAIDLLSTGEFDGLHPLKRNGDKKLVKEIYKIMSQADVLVGHYSNKFDWKYMLAKFAQYGLGDIIHIDKLDTCLTARKYYKLSSKRLGALAKFFNVDEKLDIDHGNWFAVYCKDKTAMRRITTYCKHDINALVGIYGKMENLFTVKQHVGVLQGKGKCSCRNCGSTNTIVSKTRATASGTIQKQMNCHDCHKYFTVSNAIYLRERGI